MANACKCDHWNSHPQRVQGGGGAVIWKWIKRNINGVVARHVLNMRSVIALNTQLRYKHAARHELMMDVLRHGDAFQILVLQEQGGRWNALENVGPNRDDFRGDLCEIIKRTKSDSTRAFGLQRRNGGRVGGRAVTGKSFGHAMQFLCVKCVGHSRRIRERVGDSVIHGRQARGVWIAKPCHL